MPPASAEGSTDGGGQTWVPHMLVSQKLPERGSVSEHSALKHGYLEPTDLVGPGVLALESCLESAFGNGVHEGPSLLPSLEDLVGLFLQWEFPCPHPLSLRLARSQWYPWPAAPRHLLL